MKTQSPFHNQHMNKLKTFAALLALFNTSLPSHGIAALFQNGDFESGSVGWSYLRKSGGDFIGACMNGTRGAVFNAAQVYGNGILYQTFDTTKGQSYSVNLDFGAFGSPDGYMQQLQIEVRDGGSPASGVETIIAGSGSLLTGTNTGVSISQTASIVTGFDTTGGPMLSPLSRITFDFTALSHSCTLVLSDQTGGKGQFTDTTVDNVQVQAIPEPSSIALLSLTAVSLLAYAWRRRRA